MIYLYLLSVLQCYCCYVMCIQKQLFRTYPSLHNFLSFVSLGFALSETSYSEVVSLGLRPRFAECVFQVLLPSPLPFYVLLLSSQTSAQRELATWQRSPTSLFWGPWYYIWHLICSLLPLCLVLSEYRTVCWQPKRKLRSGKAIMRASSYYKGISYWKLYQVDFSSYIKTNHEDMCQEAVLMRLLN